MISWNAVRVIDYGVMAVSGIGCLVCLGALLYSLPWSKTLRRVHILAEFNTFWKARAFLLSVGGLWLLSQWLRLEAIWEPGSQIMPGRVTRWAARGWLCRVYLCISLGVLQPLFLLTVLLLCRQSMSRSKAAPGSSPNSHLVGVAFAATVPMAVTQIILAWISLAFEDRVRGVGAASVLHYFFEPYAEGGPAQCGSTGGTPVAWCTACAYPAAASIASLGFCAVVAALLARVVARMMAGVINRRLHRRLRAFQVTFVGALAAQQAAQAATVAASPFSWAFQLVWLASHLFLVALVGSACLTLAVLPVWDTLCAGRAWQLAGGRYKSAADDAYHMTPPRCTVELNKNGGGKCVGATPV